MSAAVDLRVVGHFSSRMEARDGSMGFDFAWTYTRVVPHELIEAALWRPIGGRNHRISSGPPESVSVGRILS
jgi:hypothetical protein